MRSDSLEPRSGSRFCRRNKPQGHLQQIELGSLSTTERRESRVVSRKASSGYGFIACLRSLVTGQGSGELAMERQSA